MSWIPVLKAHDWPGASQAVCHPLLRLDQPRDDLPWIALGRDEDKQVIYPPAEELEDDDLGQLGQQAMANLARREATWEEIRPGLLACSDDWFAAERLLLPAFLAEAHEALASAVIAVAAPRRGLLLAHRAENLGPFVAWVSELFHAEEDNPVSPLVLAVRAGQIQGIIEDQGARQMGQDHAARRDDLPAHGRFQVAGYSAADQALVLTCALQPGQGLSRKALEEVGELARVKLWQGKPVMQVRVVFPSREQAERWKDKLVERGVVVQFLQPEGGFGSLS